MFARPHRLTGKAARFVIKRGYTVSGPSLRLKALPARGQVSQATIVVPLTFDKRAIRRNRVKRQLREILRPLLPQLRLPAQLAVFVHKSAAGKDFADLQQELQTLLKRLRVLD